jgi:hypothetical protein
MNKVSQEMEIKSDSDDMALAIFGVSSGAIASLFVAFGPSAAASGRRASIHVEHSLSGFGVTEAMLVHIVCFKMKGGLAVRKMFWTPRKEAWRFRGLASACWFWRKEIVLVGTSDERVSQTRGQRSQNRTNF